MKAVCSKGGERDWVWRAVENETVGSSLMSFCPLSSEGKSKPPRGAGRFYRSGQVIQNR